MNNLDTWGMGSDPGEDWREKARCRSTVHKRPELFYPLSLDKGYSDSAAIEIAKAFCATCPVREACLKEALRLGERWGVWGGLTPAERGRYRLGLLVAEQFPPVQELLRELPERPAAPRRRTGGRKKRDTCRRGHPLSGNNLRLDGDKRICKICHAARQKQVRARRREAVASC